MKLFLSPHNDDAVLFGSFTLLRERPLVVTVLDSYIQFRRGNKGCNKWHRRNEDTNAIQGVLGCAVEFGGVCDDDPDWGQVESMLAGFRRFTNQMVVYAPAIEADGHEHHNRIGKMADSIFGDRVVHYMTYTKAGKSKGVPVPYEPDWVLLKLKALACYESQIRLPSCVDHFLRPQYEYYQA